MVAMLADIAETRPYGFDYAAEVRQLRSQLAAQTDDTGMPERILALVGLAASELEAGMPGAIDRMTQAFEMSRGLPESRQREFLLPIAYHLGVAQLREARRLACVVEQRDQSCIVPLAPDSAITSAASREAANEAIREMCLKSSVQAT